MLTATPCDTYATPESDDAAETGLLEARNQPSAGFTEPPPPRVNESLCELHNVACYRVGDSCFKSSTSAELHDKWFVSTLADSELSSEDIPLAGSKEQAQSLAVQYLGLATLPAKAIPLEGVQSVSAKKRKKDHAEN